MDDPSERMQILEMISSGRISVEQGLALLRAVEGEAGEAEQSTTDDGGGDPLPAEDGLLPLPGSGAAIPLKTELPDALPPQPVMPAEPAWEPLEDAPAPIADPAEAPAPSLPFDAFKWRRWWAIPLAVGAGITLWGGLFMVLATSAGHGINLWALCASVPFVLGLLIMGLAFMSRSAPWLHLRVQQKPGERPERIALSFPLPVRPVAWFLRTFGGQLPPLKGMPLDEMLLAVGRSASPENPLYIQVDDDEDGEKVEIYIG